MKNFEVPKNPETEKSPYEIFFKAVNEKDLKQNQDNAYIPGTCTKDPKEALEWYFRYNLPEHKKPKKKEYGARRHIKRGKAQLIAFMVDTDFLLSSEEFQRSGAKEHCRKNCWTSKEKIKAQINMPIGNYIELSAEDAFNMAQEQNISKSEIFLNIERTLKNPATAY